ncbi:MAG: hypothetical protein FH756_07295 [Firmicutes bacterium]|nr:hypothetical protein [Bacillota bacterium]
MQKVRVIVTSERRVVHDGVAPIIDSALHLKVVGRKGAEVLSEAFKLQPDLLVYELRTADDLEYATLVRIKESCTWTKLLIFNTGILKKESVNRYLRICNGYLQGPVLPGFLLKAVELACYSGYFFFLGSSKELPKVRRIT